MKLSTKLLIGLLGVFVGLMLISAFSMKTEYAKINQNDAYWDFKKISDKSFKHIKVIGQKEATGVVNIIENKNYEVNIPQKWADEVKISFEKDTMVVIFTKNYKQEYTQHEKSVTILCPEVNSIIGVTTNINIDSLNQEKLIIKANKITSIDINRVNINEFKIELDKLSNCEFNYNKTYQVNAINANVASGAVLKMRNVYPKSFILNTTDKSFVEMNGTALRVLQKPNVR